MNMDNNVIKLMQKLEKEVIDHEQQHIDDMASGKLSYGDDYVRHNKKTYPRKDGMIKYNGTWRKEGSHAFPWEKRAVKADKKV